MFGSRERWREGERWKEMPIPMFGWMEEWKERRGRGGESPFRPTILHPSTSVRMQARPPLFSLKRLVYPYFELEKYFTKRQYSNYIL